MSAPRLGIRENLAQFALLVVVNAFVGAMVGLERAVIPLLGEAEFGVGSRTAVLSFIASFGLVGADTRKFRIDRAEPVYDETFTATAYFSDETPPG